MHLLHDFPEHNSENKCKDSRKRDRARNAVYVMSRMRIQEDQTMYRRDSGLTSGRQQMDVLMRPCLRKRTAQQLEQLRQYT